MNDIKNLDFRRWKIWGYIKVFYIFSKCRKSVFFYRNVEVDKMFALQTTWLRRNMRERNLAGWIGRADCHSLNNEHDC